MSKKRRERESAEKREFKHELRIISVMAALLVWQFVSMAIGQEMILASPVKVLIRLTTVWKEPGFLQAILFSFMRISIGFLLAFAAGIILGALSGRVTIIEHLLKPYVTVIKTVPVASFIILSLIWLDYNRLTVLISFLIAFPAIYSNVLTGIKSTNEKMKEMAHLYKVPWGRQLLYIYMPSVKPYIISAASVAIGMAWKAGIAAEVIGMVNGSIGEMLYDAKVYFQNADLLCWTLLIVLISVISEKIFTLILKAIFKGVERL